LHPRSILCFHPPAIELSTSSRLIPTTRVTRRIPHTMADSSDTRRITLRDMEIAAAHATVVTAGTLRPAARAAMGVAPRGIVHPETVLRAIVHRRQPTWL